MATIPFTDQEWPTYLWEDVWNVKQKNNTFVSLSMEKLELGFQLPLDEEHLYGVLGSLISESSNDKTLIDIPKILGGHEATVGSKGYFLCEEGGMIK